uniref:tetratricopeptide repeat protein n=1 Tax=Cardiobacterium hominis TaxID=2718 RepID=UPI002490373A
VQDYAQARTWYEKAAVQGHAKAQFNLGALYENGQGITQDYDKARTWYEKVAAQTDNKEAQQAAQQVLQDLDKTGNNKP